MKILLDIKDNKALYLLEVLKGLSYVKTKQLTDVNAQFLQEFKESVDEIKSTKKSKTDLKSFDSFLDEL
jgi:hypothetical protein